MNLAFEPFAQSINLNSIHPSILFFSFFIASCSSVFIRSFTNHLSPKEACSNSRSCLCVFFSLCCWISLYFLYGFMGANLRLCPWRKKRFFFYYYYLAILPYLVSFWIFEYIHMQFYCKPWCTENKLKGSVSQGALKSKEFARHMNFLIHANLSTSPKWNLSWLTAIKKQRRFHIHHKCTGAIGLLDFHWAL